MRSRRRGLRPAAVLAVLTLCGCSLLGRSAPAVAPTAVPDGAQPAVVERIVDGDTLAVRVDEAGGPLRRGQTHKIRLLEIDTPEAVAPGQPVECGGPQASAFAARRMPVGSTVFLVADVQDTDRYGRFLRYAWTEDGSFFNLDAVRTGHARAVLFEPNGAYIEVMRRAQARARNRGRGIWGEFCPDRG